METCCRRLWALGRLYRCILSLTSLLYDDRPGDFWEISGKHGSVVGIIICGRYWLACKSCQTAIDENSPKLYDGFVELGIGSAYPLPRFDEDNAEGDRRVR